MLQRLFVQNYALIEEVEIHFAPGLNILTGETGAGKSMLIGAIGLILGKRVETSALLFPEKKSIIEAVFVPEDFSWIQTMEGIEDIDLDSTELILRREISPNGKSRAFINDSPVNLTLLRSIASNLVDLHGQHDGQQLLEPVFQLHILDQYAEITQQTEAFGILYRNWLRLKKEIESMIAQEVESRRQADFLRFQVEELTKANLSEEEELRIEQELTLLENAETIREIVGKNLFELIDDELSIYNRLISISRSLEKISSLEERIATEANRLSELKYQIDDIASELQKVIDGIDTDPQTLSKLQERQTLYNKLKLKYGVKSVHELITLREQFSAQLLQLDTLEERIEEAKQRFAAIESE
ncbi:MAG: DNA repair protein RecN, partial [Bacteroidia bacterium]|nr:DNA repair protein RecN [Bacteroidia bacterium]